MAALILPDEEMNARMARYHLDILLRELRILTDRMAVVQLMIAHLELVMGRGGGMLPFTDTPPPTVPTS